jgi:hypothetical protein
VHDALTLDFSAEARRVNAPATIPPLAADEAVALRVPPQSIEAEQSVLGGLLLDNTAWAGASEILTAADFYRFEHKLIFTAIAALVGAGRPADVITVFEQLQTSEQAKEAGGLEYLNALSSSVPSAAHMRRYAEIVAERATLRAIIAKADETASRAFRNEPAANILDEAKLALGQIAEARKLGSRGVPLLTLGELREQSHAAAWLIKHVVPADSIGMLYGASGTFKSFIAIDAALHIAHGLPWMGRRTKQGDVVYLAAEGGTGLWGRICAWHKARRLHYEKVPLHVIPVALNLTADAWRLVEAVQAKGITPALVVIDTMSQTYAGEENSANEVAAYFRELATRIRQLWKCAVLIIHHSGHVATERPRGSSAMLANVDWMLGVHRDEKEMLATVSCTKQKDGERFADASFAVSVQELGTDDDGDMVKSLVARHLSSVEDIQEVMEREGKAGRGGNNHLLLSLLQNGSLESDVRTLFMRECSGETPEARKKAWQRARAWATQAGLMEVSGGFIITLKNGGQET